MLLVYNTFNTIYLFPFGENIFITFIFFFFFSKASFGGVVVLFPSLIPRLFGGVKQCMQNCFPGSGKPVWHAVHFLRGLILPVVIVNKQRNDFSGTVAKKIFDGGN